MLPGLRHVRTQLIVGYVWFLTAWLLFADRFPSAEVIVDRYLSLSLLADFASRAGIVIALSFIAYMIGSLNLEVLQILRERRDAMTMVDIPADVFFDWHVWKPPTSVRVLKANRERLRVKQYSPIMRRVTEDLVGVNVTEAMNNPSNASERELARTLNGFAEQQTDPSHRSIVNTLSRDAIFESRDPVMAQRLLVVSGDLHSEYDRLASESEMRVALVAPFIALAASAILVLDWDVPGKLAIAGVTVVIGLTLWAQSQRVQRQAQSVIVNAVAARVVSTPTLDLLEAVKSGRSLS